MKRFLGLWALLILMLASCAKLPDTSPDQTETPDCRLTLALAVPDAQRITRTLTPDAEKSVADLNLYLFGDAVDKHFFFSPCAASLTMNVPPGSYELFIIANAGRDLGAMTRQQAENYCYDIAAEGDLERNGRLVMYARQKAEIQGATSLNIALVRLAAKVEVRYSVASQAGALALQSIQVKAAPTGVRVFDTNRAATALTDYALHTLASNSGTLTAYVLENCQGVNSAVTSQALKDSAHAPQNSTYVVIKGYYADKAVAYRIYLGENNTSDFNVRENRHYVLNVQIYGANPADYRVSVSEMTVAPLNTAYDMGTSAVTTLMLVNQTDPDNTYMLTFQASKASVSIDGTTYLNSQPIPLLSGLGTKQAQVAIEAMQPGAVSLTLTVTDRYGVQFVKTLSTTFVGSTILVSASPLSEPYAHCKSDFNLSITAEGYNGNLTVKFNRLNSPDGGLTFNGTVLPADYETTVVPGTYPMSFDAGTFLGGMSTRVVVSDAYGQQVTYLIQQQITPLPITVTPVIASGIFQTETINDSYQKISYLDATLTCSRPMPVNVTVSYDLNYVMIETREPPGTLVREGTLRVTIPAGSQSVTQRIAYEDLNAPQYILRNGVETLLRRGYLIGNDVTLASGTASPAYPSIQFTINGVGEN